MTATEFREALARLGWTQAALARHLGYNPRTMSAYARGHQPVPVVLERYITLALRLRDIDLMIDIDAPRRADTAPAGRYN